jgi:hypothetical protein
MAVPKTWAANELLTNTDLNASLASTAWTAVTFTNSWVDLGGAFQTCQYRKVGDIVYVRGYMKTGTINTAAFTLPSGFRPPASLEWSTMSNGALGQIRVDSGGIFNPVTGSNVNFSVNCQFSVTT